MSSDLILTSKNIFCCIWFIDADADIDEVPDKEPFISRSGYTERVIADTRYTEPMLRGSQYTERYLRQSFSLVCLTKHIYCTVELSFCVSDLI